MRKMSNMKAKICLAAVAFTGSLVIAFAADKKATDPCTATYDKAATTCTNEKANCRARGSDEGACEKRYEKCMNDAKKAMNECQNKGGNPSGSPSRK